MMLRRVLALVILLVAAPSPVWDALAAPSSQPDIQAVDHQDRPIPAIDLTLERCYQLALKRSETIAIQQELIRETEGRFLQALGTALPSASFIVSDTRQDGSGSSAFTLKRLRQRRFSFSQPLFAGFKEFAAIAGSRAERRERQDQRERAEHLLLVDVANAFYLFLEQQDDLNAVATARTALVERLKELRERETLGRSRRSEVVSSEAQLRRAEAEIEQLHGVQTTARQLLEFLTGLSEVGPLHDTEPPITSVDPLERDAALADARPDVRAAEEAWHVSQRAVVIAQAKFWPTVDAEANYYTKRSGAAADVTWDAVLTVDVPLFQGGSAVGAFREAQAHAREAKLAYERTRREAILEIEDLHAKLQAAIASQTALKMALDAAEESFRLQTEDYRLNLVNNLEVLQALQALQDVRREFAHASGETKRLYWQLRAATGRGV